MDNNNPVSFIAFEATCTRFDRIIKRLTVALVICILLVFASNAAWLYAWLQYDYSGVEETSTTTTETITVDGKEGVANYASHGGSVVNGPDYSSYNHKDHEDPYSDSNQEEPEIEYEEN